MITRKFLFPKNGSFTSANVLNILGAVDLSKAIHITPGQASKFHGTFDAFGRHGKNSAGRVVRLLNCLIRILD